MTTQNDKEYNTPRVELVRHDETDKVFFVTSGEPASASASLGSMTSTSGSW